MQSIEYFAYLNPVSWQSKDEGKKPCKANNSPSLQGEENYIKTILLFISRPLYSLRSLTTKTFSVKRENIEKITAVQLLSNLTQSMDKITRQQSIIFAASVVYVVSLGQTIIHVWLCQEPKEFKVFMFSSNLSRALHMYLLNLSQL